MVAKRTPGVDRLTAFSLALGVLGALLVLLRGASYGVGLSPDSAYYISVARNLLEGHGFVAGDSAYFIPVTKDLFGETGPVVSEPFTLADAPPLFPLTLSLVGFFGIDAITAARYVNAIAFGLTVFTTTRWLQRRVRSRFLVVWAGSACTLALPLTFVSSFAWTEPLFILFVVLSLSALDRFMNSGRRSSFIFAAGFTAMACLTRYPGVALIAGGVVMLLSWRTAAILSRIKIAAAYGIVSATPLAAWMSRNFLEAGTWSMTGHIPSGFSLNRSLDTMAEELSEWILGDFSFHLIEIFAQKMLGIAGAPTNAGTFCLVALGTGCAILLLHRRGCFPDWRILSVPAGFVVSYAACLSLILPLMDTHLADRYLAPIYVPVLVMATLILDVFLVRAPHVQTLQRTLRLREQPAGAWKWGTTNTHTVCGAILFLWLLAQVSANYIDIREWLENGKGYSTIGWAESETVNHVRTHLRDGHIYSNNPGALYLLLDIGENANHALPLELPADTGAWMERAQADGRRVHVVWVHRRGPERFYRYGLEELSELSGLELVKVLKDGVVFRGRGT